MAYVPYVWQNLPNITTPISKANLDHLETQYQEMLNLFNAHTILMAVLNNDPAPLTVAASRIVGRKAAGNIVALTGTEVRTLIGWTNAKLLLGAGAGIAPTEIDVPNLTQEFFVPCHFGTGGVASVFGYEIGDGGDTASLKFKVPHDFTGLTSCYIIGVKITNGNIDWTVVTEFGAAGELYDNHTDTDTANAVAFVTKEVCDIDISLALDGILADDYVFLTFTLDAISAGTFTVSGLVFKYG